MPPLLELTKTPLQIIILNQTHFADMNFPLLFANFQDSDVSKQSLNFYVFLVEGQKGIIQIRQ